MGPLIIIVVLALLVRLALTAAFSPTIAWVLVVVLGALSLLLIVGNPIAGLMARRRNERYSCVPFFGGIFGLSALLICPVHVIRYFAWIPLILDITFPMFLYAVFVLRVFWPKGTRP